MASGGTGARRVPLIFMAIVTQPLLVRQTAAQAEAAPVQPVRSTRATEEMTDIAAFQELAMATHTARHQAHGGNRTLAQRLANPRERRPGASLASDPSLGKKEDGVDEVDAADTPTRTATPTRGEFEEAELRRFREQMNNSRRGPDSDEELQAFKKHAESVSSGVDVAALLREPEGQSRRQLSDATALVTGFKYDAKEKHVDASTLLTNIEAKFGKAHVDTALLDLKQAVGIESRRRLSGGPGPESYRSYSLGAAYHALISSRAIATDMRGKISATGMQPLGSSDDTGRLLLKVPTLDERTAEPFVAMLVKFDEKKPEAKPAVYRAVRMAAADLPTTMWAHEALPQRQNLLAKLDELSRHDRQSNALPVSRQVVVENKVRARFVTQLMSPSSGEHDGSIHVRPGTRKDRLLPHGQRT